MRVAVLGGDGQIGNPLVRALKEKKHEVLNFDLPEFDLRDGKDIEVYNPEFIFFLAFDVGGSTYLERYQDTYEFVNNNVELMHNVFKNLKALNRLKIERTPFIFASSQMSNMNHSAYGVLKRLGEFYTKSLGGVNVRFWNVYDHENDPDKFHVITDFINMAKTGTIEMLTDGSEERQFLHGSDAAQALLILMNHFDGLNKDKYFDITSFRWTSIYEVALLIATQFNAEIIPGETKDTVQGIKNEPDKIILDYWHPATRLEDGIKLVIKEMQ